MTRYSVYIATSLDGFIARPNGELDWLPQPDPDAAPDPNAPDYGYHAFMNSIDMLVMGRNTFETVLGFVDGPNSPWPYGDKPITVLTSRPLSLPDFVPDCVTVSHASITELNVSFNRRGIQHVYVDGGKLIQSFLTEGLIEQLIITRIPVLIGEGIPLFGRIPQDIPLTHIKTESWPNGLVQSTYRL